MPQYSATMAAPARAAQARVDWVDPCQELEELTPSTLAGWRVGLAVAIVAAVLALLALPVMVVVDPAVGIGAAAWLGGLAGVVPVMTVVRALAFVGAALVILKFDDQR